MEDNKDIDFEEKNYKRCWACGSLCLNNVEHYKRIEEHHLIGKANNDKTFSLCLLCHDFIDRMPLSDIEVYSEFVMNLIDESERLPKRDFRFTRLFILKMSKLVYESSIKSKKDSIIKENA